MTELLVFGGILLVIVLVKVWDIKAGGSNSKPVNRVKKPTFKLSSKTIAFAINNYQPIDTWISSNSNNMEVKQFKNCSNPTGLIFFMHAIQSLRSNIYHDSGFKYNENNTIFINHVGTIYLSETEVGYIQRNGIDSNLVYRMLQEANFKDIEA